MSKHFNNCKLEDFIIYPKKYQKTEVMILQDIVFDEFIHHEKNDSRLLELRNLLRRKIQNRKLGKCRICFTDLEELRKEGRKVKQFCSPNCRIENFRRKNEVYPEQVKKFGGESPVMTWSEKKERGYLLPSQRIDMDYTSRIENTLITRKIKTKKGKSKTIRA